MDSVYVFATLVAFLKRLKPRKLENQMSYLPHIYPLSATYFITFRLADSLPQHIIHHINDEYKISAAKIQEEISDEKKREVLLFNLKKEMFGNFEHQLDKNPYGKCHMKNSSIADIIYKKIME